MICDIHCHILPGVDDGARNDESTERMLNIACEEGIDYIVATPHFEYGKEKEALEELKRKYQAVRQLWKKMGNKKELFLGNEIFYSESIVDSLESGSALTMNGTKYVLVEFDMDVSPEYVKRAVQKMRYAGYYPIISHVERYLQIRSHEVMEKLIEMGAYLQVNAMTLSGDYGFFEKRRMMRIVRKGLVHFVATDAHDSKARRPELMRCVKYLKKELGEEMAKRIFEDNPIKMLKGESIDE